DSLRKFSIPSLSIFRPAMLFGKRKEFRLGEVFIKPIMQILGIFLFGKLKKYKGIYASTVAKAMLIAAKQEFMGIRIIKSDKIQELVN
ncbi:MAG: oxidoreductase, partial [FCB group bacterium]